MVSRDQLLKYGALLLIVVFVGETVFLGLSNASSSNPDNAATPTPVSFSASANASGTVRYLGFAGLAICLASTALDRELKNTSGVRTALFASSEVLAIQFEANASLDAAESLVLARCGASLFRSAGVDLPAQVYFNTSAGEQAVSSRQLDAYFSSQGVNGFQAFVSPALEAGDRLNVTIFVVVQDDRFVSITAQQPEADVLALLSSQVLDIAKVDGILEANASVDSEGPQGASNASSSNASAVSSNASSFSVNASASNATAS